VEEAYADIALVFGWSLTELCSLSLKDLITFHNLAIDRFKIYAKAIGGN